MKNICTYIILGSLVAAGVIFHSCREIEIATPTEYEIIPPGNLDRDANPAGMYILNEANMGSNKCSMDYLDFTASLYARNIYAERNPTVIKELGDVGNDLQIYGNKMYAVINCSNKVEVMDARTARRITQIDIPNCRYVRFYRGFAYVSSYVGGVTINDPNSPPGAVFKIDTLSMKIVDKVTVGYQPEEMEVVGEYLYVANSGGYRAPNYDNTVSVIELERFKQVQKIPVGINLHRLRADKYGRLWVTSRGDYKERPSNLYLLERKKGRNEMEVTDSLNIYCTEMYASGDSLYLYYTEWSKVSQSNTIGYGIIDLKTKKIITDHFITDGTETMINMPYGIAVNSTTKDIYVTDAKNYVSSGTLYCFSKSGKFKWKVRTGDIPAHMVFLKK